MDPTQRTGSFTAAALIPHRALEPETRLQKLFYRIDTHLQEAMDDGRAYTVEIKITTFITVDAMQAEIGEYVHRDHFQPNLGTQNQTLENPDVHTGKRVFQPTEMGYQRIE